MTSFTTHRLVIYPMCPNLTIPGPAGNLEAQIHEPSPPSNNNPMGIILCHPHPGYGGTMSFPLIRELFYNMGLVRAQLGEYRAAYRDFEFALELDSLFVPAEEKI